MSAATTMPSGVLAQWAVDPGTPEIGFHAEKEPCVKFQDSEGVEVLTLKPHGMVYNRDVFSRDTFRQAALRIYKCVVPKDKSLTIPLILKLNPWKEHPERLFILDKNGVDHNFELDTWHWWMISELDKLMRN
jgi:hypothetical protein